MAEIIGGNDILEPNKNDKLTQSDIFNIFRKSLTYDLTRRLSYNDSENIFQRGLILNEKDFGNHKVELKFFSRFCKAHASYVLKDRPNIYCPPISADVLEFRNLSNYTEKSLGLWWDTSFFVNKLKVGVLTASYKGDFVWFLSVNTDKEEITFNTLQPDFFAYDTVTADPFSDYLWVMKGQLIDVKELKKRFPDIKELITPTGLNNRFMSYLNFYRSDLYNLEKALYVEVMDYKYIYKYINDIEVEVIEHGYPFIPYYHLKYFDFGKKYGSSLGEFIKDPIRFLNQLLGYKMDGALKVNNPPVIITGGDANITPDGNKGGVIKIPQMGATVSYLQPPMANIQMDKMIDIFKTFIHFLSGLNEEAMAGFTGALTAAGVSIELRMDSTVREALDVQLNLKPLIEKMNRDYLKLMKQFFPKKDYFDTKEFGKLSDIPFFPNQVLSYYNTVDFGGVLPRSDTDTVRNVLAKVQGGLISKDTALEEMRYKDPGIEKNKIKSERIEDSKMQQELQNGGNVEQPFYDNPQEEDNIMMTKGKLVIPHPAQNHQEHLPTHQKDYQASQNPTILQHIIMTQELMKNQNEISKIPTRKNTDLQNNQQ